MGLAEAAFNANLFGMNSQFDSATAQHFSQVAQNAARSAGRVLVDMLFTAEVR